MAIQKVGVAGCGLMGSGIVEVSAKAGCDVVVREIDEAALAVGRGRVVKSLDRAVSKGKLTASARDETLARITFTTSLDDFADRDLVIEAIIESLGAKNELFGYLDGVCPEGTIFASNTSSLTVTDMAAATSRPDRFVGLHFFNPVPVMKLVEVVRTIVTSRETFDAARAFAERVGKVPIAARDNSGFVVNLLLVPYMLDCDPAAGAGCGDGRGHRQGDDPGVRLPHGTVHALRFRRAGHPGPGRGDHVRRIPRGALRGASAAEAAGHDGQIRDERRGPGSTTGPPEGRWR